MSLTTTKTTLLEIARQAADKLKAEERILGYVPENSLAIPGAKFRYRPDLMIMCKDLKAVVCEIAGYESYKSLFAEAVMSTMIPDVKAYLSILDNWNSDEVENANSRFAFVRTKMKTDVSLECLPISGDYIRPSDISQKVQTIYNRLLLLV